MCSGTPGRTGPPTTIRWWRTWTSRRGRPEPLLPDSQGYATKQELLEALKGFAVPGRPAGEGVRKVVACAGIVKAWASPDIGLEGALAVQKFLAGRPGVNSVSVVPDA